MNVICRRAVASDCAELSMIWRLAFPEDTQADIEMFFAVFPPEERAFVLCAGETVCSMLFLIPASFKKASERHSVGYIYAGATLPSARGQGYYKQLIAYVEATAKAEGIAMLMLCPATRELSYSYRRMGFTRPLLVTERELTDEDLLNSTAVSPQMFAAHRREWMRENGHAFIDWDDKMYDYAANWCEALVTANGQWLWISRDGKRVLECIPWQTSDERIAPFAKSLCPSIDFKQSECAIPIWFGYGLQ